jgi:hypothetical protein
MTRAVRGVLLVWHREIVKVFCALLKFALASVFSSMSAMK